MSDSSNQHIRDEFSPLETLILTTLRRYGEMGASYAEGDTILMFLEFANEVLEDVMRHPYWEKGLAIKPYRHQTDARAVPDLIMSAGLLAKLAEQQDSKKAKGYEARYFERMNTILHRLKFGVGAEYELMVKDYGLTGSGVT